MIVFGHLVDESGRRVEFQPLTDQQILEIMTEAGLDEETIELAIIKRGEIEADDAIVAKNLALGHWLISGGLNTHQAITASWIARMRTDRRLAAAIRQSYQS